MKSTTEEQSESQALGDTIRSHRQEARIVERGTILHETMVGSSPLQLGEDVTREGNR